MPYTRTDDSYVGLLMHLVINDCSKSKLMTSLRELGLPYCASESAKIRDRLMERLSDFKRRKLPRDIFALFIDGYHAEIKDNLKVRKSCVCMGLGIDLDGRRDVCGFYAFFGGESKTD